MFAIFSFPKNIPYILGIFEDVFDYFNRFHNDDETYCGFKIYAIDETEL
jgi:hypothetical protein